MTKLSLDATTHLSLRWQGMGVSIVPRKISEELAALIKRGGLRPALQPIVSLVEQKVSAYEVSWQGLPDSPFFHEYFLIETAKMTGLFRELERAFLESVTSTIHLLRDGQKLFLKASIGGILDGAFSPANLSAFVDNAKVSADKIVLTIGETTSEEILPRLAEALHRLQLIGCQVAIGDIGTSLTDMRLWAELRPDFVKLDPYFLEGSAHSPAKREFVRAFRDVALRLNCHLIACGIASAEDCRTCLELGIRIGQGHHFARNISFPQEEIPQSLFPSNASSSYKLFQPRSNTIECLVVETAPIGPTILVEQVADIFQNNAEIHSIPVLNDLNAPVGIVRRTAMMQLYLKRYGRELHGKKPIHMLMETCPMVFASDLLLEEVSLQLTTNFKLAPENDFIICQNGIYLGMGKVMELLARITELQIRSAHYANPLTLIPGNVPISETIENLLHKGIDFVVGYCDINYFKPFNDVYGYGKGDLVIKAVAKILLAHTDPKADFVGHIGGDDFIVVLRSKNWHSRFLAMLDDFRKIASDFYSETDCRNGGITALDRHGESRFYPILSLSIGAIESGLHGISSCHQIATMATDAKRAAKKKQGNSLHIKSPQEFP